MKIPNKQLSAFSYRLSAKSKLVTEALAHFLSTTYHLPPTTSQAGVAQLALVLLLLAGVAVGTYMVQTRTDLIPQAAEGDAKPPGVPGTVTNPGQIESINPSAGTEKTPEGLTKAKIVSRKQIQATEGYQIHFVWSDGRESWDTKDSQGNLIKSRSYAIRNGKKSIQLSGGTTGGITKWDDGTTEYNIFGADGKYDIRASYSTCCDKTTSTGTQPTTRTGTTTPTNTKPLSNQSRNGPDSKNTSTPTKAAPVPAKVTTTVPTSTNNVSSILTQFQSLQQLFNNTMVSKAASASATLNPDQKAAIDQLITKTNQSFTTGLQATQSCASSANATCVGTLAPLLNYTYTLVRLTAFQEIFADIPELCTRADFGITPNITATSTDGITGPIYLCSGSDGKEKKWRIFDSNNVPHTLNTADSATWKTLNDPVTTAEFPQAFQAKFSEAVALTNSVPSTTP